jgi:hypothetical protein
LQLFGFERVTTLAPGALDSARALSASVRKGGHAGEVR